MGNLFGQQTKKVLRSISGIYNTMHLFNFDKGTVVELYAFEAVHNLFENNVSKMSIQELIHHIIKKTTDKEYLSALLEFTNFDTLNERLSEKKSITFDFLGAFHGWTRATFIPVSYDKDGGLNEFIYATTIIQADKLREENLLALVDTDELTGLSNRRAFERELKNIQKNGLPEELVVVSFDVNGLKNTNDKYGHSVGDELILGAAECISGVFTSDLGTVYRVGGDEFIAIIKCNFKKLIELIGIFDSATAAWRGKRIKALTVARGCSAHLEFPDLTLEELVAKADRRMYQDKEHYYYNQTPDDTKKLDDNHNASEILHRLSSGIYSLEFPELGKPKIHLDSFVREFFGFNESATPEENYEEWFSRIHPDYRDSMAAGIEQIIIGSQAEIQYPWYHTKAGIAYVRSIGFRDSSYTEGIKINGIIQNITALVHLQKDTLTGFYTKDHFFQKADEILEKNPDKHYRIFVSDIVNFKAINEKYGIETSDRLLQYLAKSLKLMAPNLVLCGRISADKFVCLQGEGAKQTREEGLKFQHDILGKAPVPNILWKHGIYYTEFERNISAQTMYDRASFAVNSIKGNYDVSCAVYTKDLATKIKTQQQIQENMEEALKNNEFKIYLQPKFDLHKNRTGGAEALIRWIHPEIGFMNPGDFIPEFEKNGFVKNVDQFVFMEVCNLLSKWIKEGKPIVPISVNLSRRDFEIVDLADQIIEHVDKIQLPHEYLHFELTESAFSDNPENITNTLRKLHNSGFIIELDDFGAGYSSLTSLSEIEFDILKLDMSIIRKDNPDSSRNVLDMCSHIMKQMNLKSVAEGVENESQLNRLKDIGCDYIQGYYFSKPLPIEEFEEYLKRENS